MNQPNIFRQNSLTEILSIVETVLQSNNPDALQLIGEAGAGKTTLLIQLNTYLENYGIFPQVIHTNADNNYSIIKSLKNYSYAHGLEEGYELDSSRSITSKHIHRYLTGLRNPRKDILIYLVDDAHLLAEETIESLRMVFDSDISSGNCPDSLVELMSAPRSISRRIIFGSVFHKAAHVSALIELE